LDAGHHELVQHHPEFVARAQALRDEGQTPGQIMDALAIPVPSPRFKEYRRLLTYCLDLEDAINRMMAALRLVGTTLPPELLAALGMQPGEWWYYHCCALQVQEYAILDRITDIVKRSLRTLRRPYDSAGWQAEVENLLEPTIHMREASGQLRHAVAHGVAASKDAGSFMALSEIGLWECASALRGWPDPKSTGLLEGFDQPERHALRYKQLREAGIIMIVNLNQVFARLESSIDWDRVKGTVAKGGQ
jgi:hypothetical protein